MFFLRTTVPKMPMLTRKLVYKVKILYCKIRDSRIKVGDPGGVQIFTYKYVGKMFLKNLLLKNHCTTYANTYTKACFIVKILNCKHRDRRANTVAPGGIQSLIQKYVGKMIEHLLLKNHCTRSANIYTKASIYNENIVASAQIRVLGWGSKFGIQRKNV